MAYKIYMHTSPSDKRYIGITKQTTEQRWKNGNGYKRCTAFWHAICFYGWNSFSHEIIATCDTLQEANSLEIKYIEQYQTKNKAHGYNCTCGGDGVRGWKASKEQKEKNRASKKLMWANDTNIRDRLVAERRTRGATQQERDRLRSMVISNWKNPDIASALKNHLTKISRDKEIRAKSSAKMKSNWNDNPDRFMKNRVYNHGEKNKRSKPVICIDTGEKYCNARFAEKETGVDYRMISACATGKRKSAKGTHWEFATL